MTEAPSLTDIRRELKGALDGIDNAGIKVAIAATDFQKPEVEFVVCVLVGETSDAAEERLDELLAPDGTDSVRAALEDHPSVGVRKHSGYRLYPQPEGKPLLGAEWTVFVLT